MAKKRTSKKVSKSTTRKAKSTPPKSKSTSFDDDLLGGLEGDSGVDSSHMTGRMIMTVLDPGKDAVKSALKAMSDMTGMSASSSQVMYSSDVKADALETGDTTDANYVVLENLGIIILNGSSEESAAASAATPQDQNVLVEPEFWNHPFGFESPAEEMMTADFDDLDARLDSTGSAASRDFLLGARRMLDMLLEQTESIGTNSSTAQQCFRNTSAATWGLQATRVTTSSLSGQGVKLAVLDTGFDASHPDFSGRAIQRATFIPSSQPDNDVNDRNGHGTHCIGTACGSRNPGVGPRYGIAHGAEIYSGKVLRQDASGLAAGADGWILAGINWALSNRCQVISMSFGSRASSAQYPMMYERAAQRGLRSGSLILAATGNDSQRNSRHVDPVGRPANCPSIASVAAADSCLGVADFSNGQKFENGGEVNFTGPGVGVLSSVPMPRRRATFNGTSMATPHAAGIAALISAQTGKTGIELYREMRRRSMSLGAKRDFGNGLVRV